MGIQAGPIEVPLHRFEPAPPGPTPDRPTEPPGTDSWRRPDFAPGWDPNHRLAGIVIGDLLIVAWYHSIGPNLRLAAFALAAGTPAWSQDIATTDWTPEREAAYHNLVSLEVAASQLIVTIDESQGMTVLLCDPVSGRCWRRESQAWRDPIP